jgi:hypothetical protein
MTTTRLSIPVFETTDQLNRHIPNQPTEGPVSRRDEGVFLGLWLVGRRSPQVMDLVADEGKLAASRRMAKARGQDARVIRARVYDIGIEGCDQVQRFHAAVIEG